MLEPEKRGKILLELLREATVGEPEVERRVDETHDLALVEDATRVGDPRHAGLEGGCPAKRLGVVLVDLAQDLSAQLLRACRVTHCLSLSVGGQRPDGASPCGLSTYCFDVSTGDA